MALSGSAARRARRGCESVDYDVNVVHRPYAVHQSGVTHVTCFSNAGWGMLGAEFVPGSVARRPLEHLRRLPIIQDETPLNLETLRLAAPKGVGSRSRSSGRCAGVSGGWSGLGFAPSSRCSASQWGRPSPQTRGQSRPCVRRSVTRRLLPHQTAQRGAALRCLNS